ncbi:MAG: EAL domain-containing protein [Campylobacterota bacterium]|nr:EAL domain-containing protein [Campylobacterota bacterium]
MKFFNQLLNFKRFTNSETEEIDKKLIYQLYLYAKKSLLTVLVLTAIVLAFLHDVVPGYLIYPWFALSVVLTVNRLYDSYRYIGHDCSNDYKKWYKKFTYKALLTVLLWGSIPILFLPYADDIYLRLLLVMIILGLSGGAMNSLSPDTRIATMYLVILLTPLSVSFLLLGTTIGYTLFALILVYLFTLFSVTKKANELMVDTYRQQSELHTKQDELNSLFRQTPLAILYYDTNLKVLDCNHAFTTLFDLTNNEFLGFDLNTLPDPRPIDSIKGALTKGTQHYAGPYKSTHGLDLWIDAKSSPIINDQGIVLGGITLIENKTIEKEALEELQHLALHDPMTSLGNRRSFNEFMAKLILEKEHRTHFSILFYLDLNQFKKINDSLGHAVGDQLLIHVSSRLKHLIKDGYNLSRLGGDEFAIVLPFIATDREGAYIAAEACGKKIEKIFSDVFVVREMHLHIKTSIGVVIVEPNAYNIEEIIRYADISMYQAKRKGRGALSFYNAELDRERQELFKLQHDLNFAAENNQLKLAFQPIVNIKDDSLRAAESLLRWDHPEKGLLYPGQFIPLAVESGLIDDMGWWIIENICLQISDWKGKKVFKLRYISINIDAMQLQRVNFVEKLFAILEQYAIDPSEIKLEITETSLIDNFEQTREIIRTLQNHGIRCAIDDFGTGYSSLSYLKRLSFSVLKIDREFVKDMIQNPNDLFLVKNIIEIGKKLNYRIVVEGIETEEQKDILKKIDDTMSYQGFLFSPAISAEEFEKKFLSKEND